MCGVGSMCVFMCLPFCFVCSEACLYFLRSISSGTDHRPVPDNIDLKKSIEVQLCCEAGFFKFHSSPTFIVIFQKYCCTASPALLQKLLPQISFFCYDSLWVKTVASYSASSSSSVSLYLSPLLALLLPLLLLHFFLLLLLPVLILFFLFFFLPLPLIFLFWLFSFLFFWSSLLHGCLADLLAKVSLLTYPSNKSNKERKNAQIHCKIWARGQCGPLTFVTQGCKLSFAK